MRLSCMTSSSSDVGNGEASAGVTRMVWRYTMDAISHALSLDDEAGNSGEGKDARYTSTLSLSVG